MRVMGIFKKNGDQNTCSQSEVFTLNEGGGKKHTDKKRGRKKYVLQCTETRQLSWWEITRTHLSKTYPKPEFSTRKLEKYQEDTGIV